jgi:FKBP-type peptidyl-prolyl cis-trans isomerase
MNYPTKILAISIAAASCAFAQDAKDAGAAAASTPAPTVIPVAEAAAPAAPAFTDAQLLEEFGWLVGKRTGLSEWGFKPEESDIIAKGLLAALNGQESPYLVQKIGPSMDEFIQKKQAALLANIKQKNIAEASAFFAKLDTDKTVVTLPDGLRYTILAPGAGDPPKPVDTVKVNYTGTLINGTVFDSSERTGKPVEFALNKVIAGWTEGLQKISKGGKIKLYVPPQLAYGDDGRPGIPPGAVLIFDIELLDVTPFPAMGMPGTDGEQGAPPEFRGC